MNFKNACLNIIVHIQENARDVLNMFLAIGEQSQRGLALLARYGLLLARHKLDVLLALSLAVLAMALCLFLSSRQGTTLQPAAMEDAWFQADVATYYEQITDRQVFQRKTQDHPIAALLLWTAVKVPITIIGVDVERAVSLVVALIAAAMALLFYCLLRFLGARSLDSTIFTLLFLSSSSWMFYAPLAETYALGAVSVILSLTLLASLKKTSRDEGLLTAAVAASLSITITNSVIGIIGAWRSLRIGRALRVMMQGFVIITGLWVVQKAVLHSSSFFIGSNHDWHAYVFVPALRRIVESWRVLLVHSVAMPDPQIGEADGYKFLSIQHSAVGSAGTLGLVSAVLWAGLLLLGLWKAVTEHLHQTVVFTALVFLMSQLALFSIFGEESFLYSLPFVSVLIAVASFASASRFRPMILAATLALTVCTAVNNWQVFVQSAELVKKFYVAT